MENQRIRLTKTLLKNALLALLEKKPIERIAVSEICAQAQVNRTTFYKYYGSQYDLLAEMKRIILKSWRGTLRERRQRRGRAVPCAGGAFR